MDARKGYCFLGKILIVCLVSVASTNYSRCQEFSHYYNSTEYLIDAAWGIERVNDTIYMCLISGNALGARIGLLSVDSYGDEIFFRLNPFDHYSSVPSNYPRPFCITDSSAIMSAVVFYEAGGEETAALLETDLEGNPIREAKLDLFGRLLIRDFIPYGEGLMLVGYAQDAAVENGGHIWLTVDEQFEITDYQWWVDYLGLLHSIDHGIGGNFIVTGSIRPIPLSQGSFSEHLQDGFVALIDSSGTRLWTKTIGTANIFDRELGLATLPDSSGYIVFGQHDFEDNKNERHSFVHKLDVEGNTVWEREIHIQDSPLGTNDRIYSAIEDLMPTSDGGMIGVGQYQEYEFFLDLYGNALMPNVGGWIFKLNSEGELLWEHIYYDSSEEFVGAMEFYALQLAENDGAVYAAGHASALEESLLPDEIVGNPEAWLLRVDTSGCFMGDCHRFIDVANPDPTPISTSNVGPSKLVVYPNILWEGAVLHLSSHEIMPAATFRLYDQMGKLVWEHPTAVGFGSDLVVPGLPAGAYLYQLLSEDQLLGRGKVFVGT